MISSVEKTYDKSKKSLDSLLREKAYSDVQSILESKDIDINNVSDEDIETLVSVKVEDMRNELKGLGKGIVLATALFLLTGV